MKKLSTMLAIALVLGLLPIPVANAAQSTIPGHWANESIQFAIDRGYLQGDQNGNINPDVGMTRAEFVTMALRIVGISPFGASPFSDVAADAWYRPHVAAAFYSGLVTGEPDGTFRPNAYISRQESIAILARAWNMSTTGEEALPFNDKETISPWAVPYVSAMVRAGYINGDDKGNFGATNWYTFGEISQTVYNKSGGANSGTGSWNGGGSTGNATKTPTPVPTNPTATVTTPDGVVSNLDSGKNVVLNNAGGLTTINASTPGIDSAALTVPAGQTLTVQSDLTLTGVALVVDGTLEIANGVTLTTAATTTVNGTINVANGGILNGAAGAPTYGTSGKIAITGTTASVTLNSKEYGTTGGTPIITLDTATSQIVLENNKTTIAAGAATVPAAGLTLGGSEILVVATDATLNLAGALDHSSGTMTINGTVVVGASGVFTAPATYAGTVVAKNGGKLTAAVTVNTDASPIFTAVGANDAVVVKSTGLEVQGTVTLANAHTVTTPLKIADGAELVVNAALTQNGALSCGTASKVTIEYSAGSFVTASTDATAAILSTFSSTADMTFTFNAGFVVTELAINAGAVVVDATAASGKPAAIAFVESNLLTGSNYASSTSGDVNGTIVKGTGDTTLTVNFDTGKTILYTYTHTGTTWLYTSGF